MPYAAVEKNKPYLGEKIPAQDANDTRKGVASQVMCNEMISRLLWVL